MRHSRIGFSMIEMLAVTVVLGLLSTAAGLSLRSVHRHASFEQTVAGVIDFQHSARLMARRFGQKSRLTIDPTRLGLTWIDAAGRLTQPAPLELPVGCQLQPLTIADPQSGDDADAIAISSSGRSRSYALCVRGPEAAQQQWMVISGLTGQITRVENDKQAKDILAALRQTRIDAD